MFLEDLLQQEMNQSAISMINMIISQLNLLLCLVNNVLDIKLIEQQKFQVKEEKFDPMKVLDFIAAMFRT